MLFLAGLPAGAWITRRQSARPAYQPMVAAEGPHLARPLALLAASRAAAVGQHKPGRRLELAATARCGFGELSDAIRNS